MTVSDDFSRRVAELSQILLSDQTIDTFLQQVTDLSVDLIPACDSCSVSAVEDGKVRTRVSSDEVAERVDEHQYSTGQGPCLEAISTGRAVRILPFPEEPRWSEFPAKAVSEGVMGAYSVPLTVQERTIGALNLYGRAGPFADSDGELAESFAGHAAVAVANAHAYHQARELSHHLEEALKSRDVIGQAKGIIMERERMTPDQAFDVLRAMSQARNIKLRELAELVVFTGTWKDPVS